MRNAASCATLVREALADQIADRLSDVDELIGEVKQRKADMQEISRLYKVTEDIQKTFQAQARTIDEWKQLDNELRPHWNRIKDLNKASKRTASRIEAFASSLDISLTLWAVHFPKTETIRGSLGQLRLSRDYGSCVPWDSGYEILTTARYLLGEICNVVSRGSASVAPFPTPGGSRWEDVDIRFLSYHRAQITVGEVTEPRNFAEFGLEDGRSDKPTKIWELLRTLAIEGSIRRPAQLKESDWPAVEKQVQRLRKSLRSIFRIPGDPFHRSREGYRPRFRISFPHPDQR